MHNGRHPTSYFSQLFHRIQSKMLKPEMPECCISCLPLLAIPSDPYGQQIVIPTSRHMQDRVHSDCVHYITPWVVNVDYDVSITRCAMNTIVCIANLVFPRCVLHKGAWNE